MKLAIRRKYMTVVRFTVLVMAAMMFHVMLLRFFWGSDSMPSNGSESESRKDDYDGTDLSENYISFKEDQGRH